MMSFLARCIVRTLATATLLSSVGAAGCSAAGSFPEAADLGSSSGATLLVQDAAPTGPVQTPTLLQPPTQENRANQPSFDPVTERIKYLHDRLRITPAQEPLWAKVAEAMRDSAKAVAPIINERVQRAKTGDAIDYLSSYEKLGEAQLEGLKKFSVAFQELYNSLSDEQKKIADSVFRLGPLGIAGGIPELPEQLMAPPPSAYYPSYPAAPPYPGYPPYSYYPYYPYYYPSYAYEPYLGPWIWAPPFFGLETSFFFFHEPRFHHPFPLPGQAGVAPVPPPRLVPPPRPVPPIRPLPPGGIGLLHGFHPPSLAGVAAVPPRPASPVRPVPPIRPFPPSGVGLLHR
jgi:hypothetical protein